MFSISKSEVNFGDTDADLTYTSACCISLEPAFHYLSNEQKMSSLAERGPELEQFLEVASCPKKCLFFS
jgi:hypothetical protein